MRHHFRQGGRFYSSFFCSSSKNVKVKELLKSVHICQSYHKKTAWMFYFDSQCMACYFIYLHKSYPEDFSCLLCIAVNTTEIVIKFLRATAYAVSAHMLSQFRLSVCLSVCPSVTRVIHAKTVEVRIMQFSPYSSPIPLVFAH